jgi:hypothetical protein
MRPREPGRRVGGAVLPGPGKFPPYKGNGRPRMSPFDEKHLAPQRFSEDEPKPSPGMPKTADYLYAFRGTFD